MNLRILLENYLLNEKGGLEALGRSADDIIKDLQGIEKNLGPSGKLLRNAIRYLDDLSPADFAKLEKKGINVADLLSKAEKATAENADDVAREIERAIKTDVPTGVPVKKGPALSPEEALDKDFKALMARADSIQGFSPKAANNLRKKAFKLIGEEFEEATKLPSAKADEWAKLNAQRVELLSSPNTPRQITDDIQRQMDAIYPRSSWQKISQWARENPKKAWLFGFLGTGAFSMAAYETFKSGRTPSPTPKPAPVPGPGGGGRKGGGIKWKECEDLEMKRGCKGDNVRVIQSYLVNMDYNIGKEGVDSKFGSGTETALKRFQKDFGLPATGKINQQTLDKIDEIRVKGLKTVKQTPVPEEAQAKTTPEEKGVPREQLPGLNKMQDYNVSPSGATVEEPEKLKKSKGTPIGENKFNKKLKFVSNRNEQIENLVFERLVKNAN